MKYPQKYKAFTLIEMLLVMAIAMALLGIGASFFGGMRSTILLNQSNETLKQNFRYAQRSAMLLKRDLGENWIYGIGIDLTQFYSRNTYRIFKWCSPYEEFSDSTKASGIFPNFEDGDNLTNNGKLPVVDEVPTYLPVGVVCDRSNVTPLASQGVLIEMPNRGSGAVGTDSSGFQIQIQNPLRIGVRNVVTRPSYVLYESGSGRVFFYDSTGSLINYDVSTNELIPDPVDVEFVITTVNGEKGSKFRVAFDSGRITSNPAIPEEIIGLYVFNPPLGEIIRPPQSEESEEVEPPAPVPGPTPTPEPVPLPAPPPNNNL